MGNLILPKKQKCKDECEASLKSITFMKFKNQKASDSLGEGKPNPLLVHFIIVISKKHLRV